MLEVVVEAGGVKLLATVPLQEGEGLVWLFQALIQVIKPYVHEPPPQVLDVCWDADRPNLLLLPVPCTLVVWPHKVPLTISLEAPVALAARLYAAGLTASACIQGEQTVAGSVVSLQGLVDLQDIHWAVCSRLHCKCLHSRGRLWLALL